MLAVRKAMSEVSPKTGSVFTGEPVELVNTPVTELPEGYSMVYAVSPENAAPDPSAYSAEPPTATEGGTWYVWYKVVRDGEDVAGPESVETAIDYSIDVVIEGKGEVGVVVGKSAAAAQPGESVSLSVSPAASYKLESLTWTDSNGDSADITEEGSFTMPAANVTVTAVFVKTQDDREDDDHHHYDLFLLDGIMVLPRTGFSAINSRSLGEKPLDLNYQPLRLTLEIPSVSTAAEIVSVPFVDGEYPVTWLGSDAGLLEGSALPGMGQAVITGHNHLNTTEAGPFAGLNRLKRGDRIFVSGERGEIRTFVVYANEKVAESDINAVNRLISADAFSLTLITCEDERPEGGYANRRVIAAKPL